MKHYSSKQTACDQTRSVAGFTLIELVVTVGIIAILTAIFTASFSSARATARDKQRIAEIEQISLALDVYKQAYGAYPDTSGLVGEGGSIDSFLNPFLSPVPHDPLGPNDETYQYRYDSSFACDGVSSVVIYAAEMEKPVHTNGESTCSDSSVGDGYIKVIGPGESSSAGQEQEQEQDRDRDRGHDRDRDRGH